MFVYTIISNIEKSYQTISAVNQSVKGTGLANIYTSQLSANPGCSPLDIPANS